MIPNFCTVNILPQLYSHNFNTRETLCVASTNNYIIHKNYKYKEYKISSNSVNLTAIENKRTSKGFISCVDCVNSL